MTTKVKQIILRDCRQEVKDFACMMEKVLRENDYKGGWKCCTNNYLEHRMQDEVNEVVNIHPTISKTRAKQYCKETVDVANFAMMIWDNNRCKKKKETEE